MGISQAQTMLQQLLGQLTGSQFAQQANTQLGAMGAGKIKAKKMFQTPPQEQQLMDSVLQRVLGYYGGGMQGGIAGPTEGQSQILPGFGMPMQRGTGGTGDMRFAPGFGQEQLMYSGADQGGITKGGGPSDASFMPVGGGAGGEDVFGGGMQEQLGPPQMEAQRPFPNGAQTIDDLVGSMWNQQQAQQSVGNVPVAQNPWAQIGLGGGLPNLDPNTQNQLNSIFQPQMDQMNSDFGEQKNQMLQDLFGRGMAQSSAAGDVGGKLLTGRSTALNQIQGQKAQAELALRQQLMEQIGSKAAAGEFRGGGMVPPNAYGGGIDGAMTASLMGQIENMDRPMNFAQKMQADELALKRAALAQEGQLSGRGLDIQQLLGLGSQGLQSQGLGQDLMMQLFGLGAQRQQSQAGLASSEAARLQQFLQGQQTLGAGIGSQQAQMEAQKKSLFEKIMSGVLGGASSVLGAAGSAGGFGSLFR